MPRSPAVARIALAILGTSFACGLGEIFADPGPRDVHFIYLGPTVIDVGDTVPFSVTVVASGRPVDRPRLGITSSDPAILRLTAGLDSLIGCAAGPQAFVNVRLHNSLLSGNEPDTSLQIQVRGGPGPNQCQP